MYRCLFYHQYLNLRGSICPNLQSNEREGLVFVQSLNNTKPRMRLDIRRNIKSTLLREKFAKPIKAFGFFSSSCKTFECVIEETMLILTMLRKKSRGKDEIEPTGEIANNEGGGRSNGDVPVLLLVSCSICTLRYIPAIRQR